MCLLKYRGGGSRQPPSSPLPIHKNFGGSGEQAWEHNFLIIVDFFLIIVDCTRRRNICHSKRGRIHECPSSFADMFHPCRRDSLADVSLSAPSQHVLSAQQQLQPVYTMSDYESAEDEEPSAFSTEDEDEAGGTGVSVDPATGEGEGGGGHAQQSHDGASSDERF